ncbi:MAG: amidohydrolase family protein [Acidobacteria bacterium]|nr:amidohydrolase family protein [Acidobacteriota bacterium]
MRKLGSLIIITTMLFASAVSAESPRITVIKAGRLVDTEKAVVLENQLILIENNLIKAVGTNLKIPEGAIVIDLSNSYVLPGFIDAHVHLTSETDGNYYDNLFRRSFVDSAITAHLNAKATLDAGFTSVRNLGADAFIDVALKNAINSGKIPGPRMQIATFNIAATGNSAAGANHRDLSGFSPWLDSRLPEEISNVADGPEGLRKKVRYLIKYGAEVIKFRASGGVLSEEAQVGAPKFSQEEMNAIVAEARLHGIKVAAHAHGAESIKMAIRAGVDSIEHGSFLDDEGIRMMKERGTVLVADIYNDDYILAEFGKLGYPDKILEKERFVGRTQRENFRKAVAAGVKVAYGTDAGVYPHGWNAKQFSKMVEWGLTPMEAIRAATVGSAELLGWSGAVGSIAPGKFADIVAVPTDPLRDITVLEKLGFVMKDGNVVRSGR